MSEYEEDDSLNPIRPEFWVGQILMVAGVAAGVWIAARAGFTEAVRFATAEDHRQAQIARGVLKAEFERNLEVVRDARARTEARRRIEPLSLDTSFLEKAESEPFLSVLDPALLSELQRFVGAPLSMITGKSHHALAVETYLAFCDKALGLAENSILPLFAREERRLSEAIARIEGKR